MKWQKTFKNYAEFGTKLGKLKAGLLYFLLEIGFEKFDDGAR